MGFVYTFGYCLGSDLFLHFKTLLLEDLNLCQISSDHRLSSFTEKKSPRPFLAFSSAALKDRGWKGLFSVRAISTFRHSLIWVCYILSNWRTASELLKNSFLSFQVSAAIIRPKYKLSNYHLTFPLWSLHYTLFWALYLKFQIHMELHFTQQHFLMHLFSQFA